MTSDPSWPRASDWLARNDTDPASRCDRRTHVGRFYKPVGSMADPGGPPRGARSVLDLRRRGSCRLRWTRRWGRGDWPIARMSATSTIAVIEGHASELEPGPVYAFLGGDNVITYPIVKALSHAPLERFGVLTFDAHHDVRETKDGISNGTPIRALIEAGLPGDHVTQIGIHSFANSRNNRAWARPGDTHRHDEERGGTRYRDDRQRRARRSRRALRCDLRGCGHRRARPGLRTGLSRGARPGA